MKTYTTKPNARRAARKAGIDPDLVCEVPGGFMVDTPPPATIEPGQIDLPSMAWLFDCSARQIQKLAKRGIAVRIPSGVFDEKASVRNYVRHLREQAAGRVGQDPEPTASRPAWRGKRQTPSSCACGYRRKPAKSSASKRCVRYGAASRAAFDNSSSRCQARSPSRCRR